MSYKECDTGLELLVESIKTPDCLSMCICKREQFNMLGYEVHNIPEVKILRDKIIFPNGSRLFHFYENDGPERVAGFHSKEVRVHFSYNTDPRLKEVVRGNHSFMVA